MIKVAEEMDNSNDIEYLTYLRGQLCILKKVRDLCEKRGRY